MSRARSEAREQALKIWIKSNREKSPSQIAFELGISPGIVRKWKSIDRWDEIPVKPKRRGAPEGNKNAIGNRGGTGAPAGNDFALKHGFYSRIFPEEVHALVEEIDAKDPIEVLWDQIVTQQLGIARGQRLMFVRDSDEDALENQATFLKAQSIAMTTLHTLIRRYDDMVTRGLADEEQRLRIEKLKLQLKQMGGPGTSARKLESFL